MVVSKGRGDVFEDAFTVENDVLSDMHREWDWIPDGLQHLCNLFEMLDILWLGTELNTFVHSAKDIADVFETFKNAGGSLKFEADDSVLDVVIDNCWVFDGTL